MASVEWASRESKQLAQTNEGDNMNVMAKAHKTTRECFAIAPVGSVTASKSYREVFTLALKQAHQEYKAMNQAELLKADTIAKFEKRIVELQTILTTPVAQKFMVVCGDEHPMPIDFEATNPKWPWANVEGATKWSSIQFARANASKVVNGNNQVGKAVKVADHIEWDIANLQKLIKDLKGE